MSGISACSAILSAVDPPFFRGVGQVCSACPSRRRVVRWAILPSRSRSAPAGGLLFPAADPVRARP